MGYMGGRVEKAKALHCARIPLFLCIRISPLPQHHPESGNNLAKSVGRLPAIQSGVVENFFRTKTKCYWRRDPDGMNHI